MPDSGIESPALVNDELALGYNEKFEDRFIYLQRAGQWVLVGVMLAGLAGLLGRGPFSHAVAASADGAIELDYEPVARFGTNTQVTLRIRAPGASSLRLTLDTKLVEPMGLQDTSPRPVIAATSGSGLAETFAVGTVIGGQTYIRLHLKPTVAGPEHLQVAVDGVGSVRWSQFVLP